MQRAGKNVASQEGEVWSEGLDRKGREVGTCVKMKEDEGREKTVKQDERFRPRT